MLYYRKIILGIILQLRHIHKVNILDENSGNHQILHSASSKMLLLVNVFIWLTVCTMSFFAMYPIALYAFTGIVEPIFPMQVPFLNQTTKEGFVGMTCCHLTWLVQTGLGLAAADLLIVMLVLYVLPLVEMFRMRFKELNQILLLGKTAQESELVYQSLRNLVKMHQDISTYLNNISTVFFYAFCAEVLGDAITILMIIYILSTVSVLCIHKLFSIE